MRGRKPLPTARRQLEGNPGKRPFNKAEPKIAALDETFDTPPPELADHELAAKEWTRLAPVLRKARHVGESDRTALLALCLEWERYLEATAAVRRLGMVSRAPSGYPIPNPYLSIATRALTSCNKLWPELGLTPSSRTRVTALGEDPASDPFAEFDEPLDDSLPTH